MSEELPEVEFQRFWRRLQRLGLNAYESRSYLVLLAIPNLRPSNSPPAPTCRGRRSTKCSTALSRRGSPRWCRRRPNCSPRSSPAWPFPATWRENAALLDQELTDQSRPGTALVDDLKEIYSEGQGGRGTLDYLRIVTEPAQTGAEYRRMLSEVKAEYLEFSRPPYAVDPLDEKLVKQACLSGVSLQAAHRDRHARRPAPQRLSNTRRRASRCARPNRCP